MGIGLERIYPGKPQQNGRHERMHGTLKAQTCDPPADTAAQQQRWFDAFQHELTSNDPMRRSLRGRPLSSIVPPRERSAIGSRTPAMDHTSRFAGSARAARSNGAAA